MTAFATLWLPILAATIAVFFASALLNSVLPWHKNDFPRVPDEDAFIDAVRPLQIPRGEYMVPRVRDRAEMKSAEHIAKMNAGPVMVLTVFRNGVMSMGAMLGQWFVYCLFVTVVSACVAHSIVSGADHVHAHDVLHYAGIVAFSCYAVGLWQTSIWYGRPWSTTLKTTVDGAVYALLTGGILAWLWP